MKTSELLIKAKAVIANPEHWTQGALGRDGSGKQADFMKDAVCFCSIGALLIAKEPDSSTMKAESLLRLAGNNSSIADMNDNHTHEEVMAVWDKAIEQAKLLEE